MSKWFRFIILMGILGLAKAHHWIRLIILAGMGLAGLWMLHTLAQDFNKIFNKFPLQIAAAVPKFLFKRSISSINTTEAPELPEIDWERILSRDPVGCARSFVCQLVATNPKELSVDESNILRLVRSAQKRENWASKQLQIALKYGQQTSSLVQCRKRYKFCPYSSKVMMHLLRFFAGT